MAATANRLTIGLLAGGVGGARAALALAENLPAAHLTFVVNTGDDFHHLGLPVWPDWDTVVYTLSGLGDAVRGWGRADEGTRAMEEFRRLDSPHWFHLGDRDLALHVHRNWALSQQPADEVARQIAERLGVNVPTLRVSEESLNTEFVLDDGEVMDFQTWFVRHQGRPVVSAVRSQTEARITPGVLEAIAGADLLLLAPSNPYLSLFPMLDLPAVGQAVRGRSGPTWAVSPLVGGKAVKGPLDALIAQLSPHRGQQAIAELYRPWIDRLLLPAEEISGIQGIGLKLQPCRTWLGSEEGRKALVEDLLAAWNSAL